MISLSILSQKVLFDLRNHIFSHLQILSVSFYDWTGVGRIMSRAQNDVSQLQEFLGISVNGIADLVSLIGIVIAMIFLDIKMSLVVLFFIPLFRIFIVKKNQMYHGAFFILISILTVVFLNTENIYYNNELEIIAAHHPGDHHHDESNPAPKINTDFFQLKNL